MEAVRVLGGDIGPRPACSDEEERAAEWCADRLRDRGLEVTVDRFPSRPSATPWTSVYLGLAAFGALVLEPAPLVSFVLSLAALVLYARDVEGRPLIPPRGGTSTNVIARRNAASDPSLVVVAELDSARASPRFNPRFPPGPRGWALVVHAALIGVPVVSGAAWIAESARPLPPSLWLVGAALAAALCAALVADLRAERTFPLLDGANDNATGVEAIMQLSARFAGEGVWWVLPGSGHSGQIGMQAFLEDHGHRLGGARILALRGLGAGELDAPADEGVLGLRRADPALLDAAVEAGAASTRLRATQTAAAVAITHRRRAATIVGLDARGGVARQGWGGDTGAGVDENALRRAIDVIARVIEVVTGERDPARAQPPLAEGHGPT
jgi:hypothetical protein